MNGGFFRTMREESSIQNRDFMLDYLINLLEDATDFSWASAKATHAVLLCRMEQGEIRSWSETEKIDRVRRAHAQRHVSHVFILIRVHVFKSNPTKLEGFFTNMYVHTAGKRKQRNFHMHRKIVKRWLQKTNKWGYAQ